MKVSLTVIISVILIFLGVFINFLPTIIYYIQVYPHIPLNKVGPGAYFTYNGIVAIPLRFANGSQILLSLNITDLNVTVLGNNSFKITLEGQIGLFNGSYRYYHFDSSFLANSSNPFIRMMFANKSSMTAVVYNKMLPLRMQGLYMGHAFGGLDPYSAEYNGIHANFIWYILFNGGELVMSNLFVNGPKPYYSLYNATVIFFSLIRHASTIKRLTTNVTPLFNETLISITPGISNVKTVNNIAGEIAYSFGTFLPINVVLILIGAVILILKLRGKLH